MQLPQEPLCLLTKQIAPATPPPPNSSHTHTPELVLLHKGPEDQEASQAQRADDEVGHQPVFLVTVFLLC